MKKKFGLVGGLGPTSTLDYYKGINDGYKNRLNSDNSLMVTDNPFMVIDSLNLAEAYSIVDKKQWPALVKLCVDSLNVLKAGGAQCAAIAANTAHIVFDDIKRESPLPLISIVEETCKYAKSKGCKRVIVFGTGFTMSSGLFDSAFKKYGMEAFVPNAEDQKTIHNIIFPNLENGLVLPEEKKAILEIANRMISELKADGLILGCTELPLIIKEGDLDTNILDTTQIHIDAILDWLME